jgi:hypothetical protein
MICSGKIAWSGRSNFASVPLAGFMFFYAELYERRETHIIIYLHWLELDAIF